MRTETSGRPHSGRSAPRPIASRESRLRRVAFRVDRLPQRVVADPGAREWTTGRSARGMAHGGERGTRRLPVRARLRALRHHDAAGDAGLALRSSPSRRSRTSSPWPSPSPTATRPPNGVDQDALLRRSSRTRRSPSGRSRRTTSRAALAGDATPADVAAAIADLYARYARGTASRATATRRRRTSSTSSCSPVRSRTARFLHIVRDGRDVVPSLMEMHFGPDRFGAAALFWRDRVSRGPGRRAPRSEPTATARSATRTSSPTRSRCCATSARSSICAFEPEHARVPRAGRRAARRPAVHPPRAGHPPAPVARRARLAHRRCPTTRSSCSKRSPATCSTTSATSAPGCRASSRARVEAAAWRRRRRRSSAGPGRCAPASPPPPELPFGSGRARRPRRGLSLMKLTFLGHAGVLHRDRARLDPLRSVVPPGVLRLVGPVPRQLRRRPRRDPLARLPLHLATRTTTTSTSGSSPSTSSKDAVVILPDYPTGDHRRTLDGPRVPPVRRDPQRRAARARRAAHPHQRARSRRPTARSATPGSRSPTAPRPCSTRTTRSRSTSTRSLRFGPYDAHLVQFSGAIWYPMVYRLPAEEKQALGRRKRANQLARAARMVQGDRRDAVLPVRRTAVLPRRGAVPPQRPRHRRLEHLPGPARRARAHAQRRASTTACSPSRAPSSSSPAARRTVTHPVPDDEVDAAVPRQGAVPARVPGPRAAR